MKALKKLIIVIVALVALLMAAGFIASQFISKEFVQRQLAEVTGRNIIIEGSLSPKLSLTPSLRAENVSFGNATWGSRKEMAKIGNFDIELKLIPLFSGQVEVNNLNIDNADILLEKKGDKWNFALDKKEVKEKTADENNKKSDMKFDISSLKITNSILTIKQGGSPTVVEVKKLEFAPRENFMGLDYEGSANKSPIKFSVDLPALSELMNTKKFELNNIKLDAAGFKLNGNGSIDISGKPYIKGNFASDTIDLGGAEKSAEAAPAKTAKKGGDKPLPFDALNAFDADLKLKIGKFKSGNIVLENISAPVKVKNGTLNASPLTAQFAGGSIDSSIQASAKSTSLKVKGDNLKMQEILKQTASIDKFENGPTNIDINVSGSGNSVDKIIGSLSGTSKIYMKEGVYKGRINTGSFEELSQLLAGGNSSTTPINCVLGDINWNGGTGNIKNFAVDTKHAYATATGTIRPANKTVNVTVKPVSKSTSLASLAVPVVVKGTFDNLSFYPDAQGTAETLLKKGLQGYLAAQTLGGSEVVKSVFAGEEGNSPCGLAITRQRPAPAEAPQNGNQQPAAAPTPEKQLENKLNEKLKKLF